MISSVVEGGSDEGRHESSSLLDSSLSSFDLIMNSNLSLPSETFLKAAISLKDKVCDE